MGDEPRVIDLLHLGRPRVIGAWVLGGVVVDPGPASCLPALLEGLEGRAPRVLALTHIHLDHAGAAGSLVRRFPDLEVWVHERGAPHLVDPGRLLDSARRLYGDRMEPMWGEVLPVPEDRLRVLRGGEELDGLRVAYTPGHASHHVSYMHGVSGLAFTGDVAGVRVGAGPVLAPTPPPDIDLGAWRASLELIERWQPRGLAVTHFGAHLDVAAHLAAIRERLAGAEELAAAGDPGAFERDLTGRVVEADPELAGVYGQAMPPEQSWAGLRRWMDRRG